MKAIIVEDYFVLGGSLLNTLHRLYLLNLLICKGSRRSDYGHIFRRGNLDVNLGQPGCA